MPFQVKFRYLPVRTRRGRMNPSMDVEDLKKRYCGRLQHSLFLSLLLICIFYGAVFLSLVTLVYPTCVAAPQMIPQGSRGVLLVLHGDGNRLLPRTPKAGEFPRDLFSVAETSTLSLSRKFTARRRDGN
ncbi:hypothetical protein CDAR_52671 [Caerostris darwini]|uniref:Uncharacterized protein n=1 Tax=Caerostris darwini TaxID=1538125 RepID=A0AAV4T3B8_9ARAC|nr:hypothetical protein CDAR_52671 [Caerostris darwini]